jgi:hypothetical protein
MRSSASLAVGDWRPCHSSKKPRRQCAQPAEEEQMAAERIGADHLLHLR